MTAPPAAWMDNVMPDIKTIANTIEGILFLSPVPVALKSVMAHLAIDQDQAQTAFDMLVNRYNETDGGLEIMQSAGGYEIVTRKEYSEPLRSFFGKMDRTRISRAALETLSVIAYKQPVTRSDIEAIRGVNSSGVIHSMLDWGLIRIVGKGDGVGRPFLFGTTPEFLRFLGLNSLEDLPPLDSLEKKI